MNIVGRSKKYHDDIIECMHANFLEDERKRNEYIYDTVCDKLDEKFLTCNYCDFKDDACFFNRCRKSPHSTMGCCYQFEYNNFFHLHPIKNIKQCALLEDRKCSTKNISCKLFTCLELKKEKGVNFNLHDFLLIECFLDRKQKDVIEGSFFVKREDILDKLMEKNDDSYFSYFMHHKYRIDKRY